MNQPEKWAFKTLGGKLWLVNDTGPRNVIVGPDLVFSDQTNGPSAILCTRDEATGLLRPLEPTDRVARMIEAASVLLDICEMFLEADSAEAVNIAAGMAHAAISKIKGKGGAT